MSENLLTGTQLETLVQRIKDRLDNKQSILTAGTGIKIDNNIISSTFDSSIFIPLPELPEASQASYQEYNNKIILIKNLDIDDSFDQFIIKEIENSNPESYEWVSLGNINLDPSIDLTYATDSEVDDLIRELGIDVPENLPILFKNFIALSNIVVSDPVILKSTELDITNQLVAEINIKDNDLLLTIYLTDYSISDTFEFDVTPLGEFTKAINFNYKGVLSAIFTLSKGNSYCYLINQCDYSRLIDSSEVIDLNASIGYEVRYSNFTVGEKINQGEFEWMKSDITLVNGLVGEDYELIINNTEHIRDREDTNIFSPNLYSGLTDIRRLINFYSDSNKTNLLATVAFTGLFSVVYIRSDYGNVKSVILRKYEPEE